jgi:hypothetical protein
MREKDFENNEIKIGNPTKSQMDFAINVADSVSLLKLRQVQKNKIRSHLDKGELFNFLKEKYKLVKLIDDLIIVRYSKSCGVLIRKYDIILLRFYNSEKTFTLSEMIENFDISNVASSTCADPDKKFSMRTLPLYNRGWGDIALM